MSQARCHLRAALFLAAVSPRGATTGVTARRGLSAWPAPQEPGMEYQDAVRTLNTLQTNAGYLEQVKRQRRDPQTQLEAMKLFLARSGLQVEDLDQLNIIHVTGTKGKDSSSCVSMPAYFRFLTLMAFHVFLQEKVDLAVVEVGIGGAYDCTNIIRKPVVCGVSSLGIDHTSLLGDTVEEIAWQKGGIFKRGVPAFTVLQPDGPLAVLWDRAQQISCPLYLCPPLEALEEGGPPLALGLDGEHQRFNAALALQLARCWLQQKGHQGLGELKVSRPSVLRQMPLAPVFQPTPHMRHGLRDTEWLGRTQVLRRGPLTWYLDGAHTASSVQACVRWFHQALLRGHRPGRGPEVRILLFNSTGDRDSAALLKLLQPCQFDYAVFCPNLTEVSSAGNADQQNFMVTLDQVLLRCLAHQQYWSHLAEAQASPDPWSAPSPEPGEPTSSLLASHPPRTHSTSSLVFSCISHALQWISQGRDPVFQPPSPPQGLLAHPVAGSGAGVLREAAAIHVLVTGSLHLVGGVLKLLEPALSQ
ncbi:folylpolyglutamate synthase, mitochondrial isoform X4 [Mirounga angustirostris]|uniref:folylpolyglutamate synthase, mitochondrial isoform X4 n=1 Tax=Mirounga angustirostris TaxID=9716 RepID=UPI00313EB9D2